MSAKSKANTLSVPLKTTRSRKESDTRHRSQNSQRMV